MNKKLLSIFGVIMLSLVVLVGCNNNANNEKKPAETETKPVESTETTETEKTEEKDAPKEEATITFWHAMGGGQGEALEALVKDFEEANPHVKVNLQGQGNYGDLNQKLTATLQSPKDLPTLIQAYPDWVVDLKEANLLVDLKPYTDKMSDFDDILPRLIDEVKDGDAIYGMPFNKSTEVLWYNKTMLDELGLEVPTNLEELEAVSKEIHAKKGIPGVGFDSLSNYYSTYLANNGSAMGPDLDVTSDVSREAVEYYKKGIDEGYFRIAGTDKYMSGPFAAEQVAMYVGSNAGEVFVKDGVNGAFEYAAAKAPFEKTIQQGTNVYLLDNATDAEKQAAFDFLEYLTSKDAQIKWATSTGYMPVRQTAISDAEYTGSESVIPAILSETTNDLYTNPAVKGSGQARRDVDAFLESVFSNPSADIKQELENFKATYESDFM